MGSEMTTGAMIPLGWSAINAAGFPLVKLDGPEWVDVGAEPGRVSEFLRDEMANGGRRIDARFEDLRRAGVAAGISADPASGFLGINLETEGRQSASVVLRRDGQEWEIDERVATCPPIELDVRQRAKFDDKTGYFLQIAISGGLGVFMRIEGMPLLKGQDILGGEKAYAGPVEAFAEIGARLMADVPSENWSVSVDKPGHVGFAFTQYVTSADGLTKALARYFYARDDIYFRLGNAAPNAAGWGISLSLELGKQQTLGGLLMMDVGPFASLPDMQTGIIRSALAIVMRHLPAEDFSGIIARQGRGRRRITSGVRRDAGYGLYLARKIAEAHGLKPDRLPVIFFVEAPPPAGPSSQNPVLAHVATRIDREKLIDALAKLFDSTGREALLRRLDLRAGEVAGFERARNNEEQARAMVEYLDGADSSALVQLYNMARIERPANSGLPELG